MYARSFGSGSDRVSLEDVLPDSRCGIPFRRRAKGYRCIHVGTESCAASHHIPSYRIASRPIALASSLQGTRGIKSPWTSLFLRSPSYRGGHDTQWPPLSWWEYQEKYFLKWIKLISGEMINKFHIFRYLVF